jgi:hypothetical protein
MKRAITFAIAALCASSASAWQYTSPYQPRPAIQPLAPKLAIPQPWTATTIGLGSGFATTTIQPPPLSRLPAVHCTTIDLGGIATMTCR